MTYILKELSEYFVGCQICTNLNQNLAIMIHIKLNMPAGFLIFILFLSSCTTVNRPISNLNKFSRGAMNQLTNDSLGVKIAFYGNANFGSKYIDLKDVKSVFRKRQVKFPSKNIIFWGTYESSTNPMYVVGSLEAFLDISRFTLDSSMHGSIYYRNIQLNKNNIITRIAIPYTKDLFLLINEIWTETGHRNENIKEALNHVKTTYSSLTYGANFSKEDPDEEINYFDIAESAFKDKGYANYLSPRDTLQKLLVQNKTSQYASELFKSYSSFLGESVKYDSLPEQEQFTGKKTAVSIDDIAEKIKRHRVVMFNENHLLPRCRLVVNLLLPKLYKEGFNVLALEGLSEDEERINKFGFPNIESGFYTRDPNMANLIRTATKLGLKVISYEDFEDTEERDLSQARNLIRKTEINTKSDTKVIVLAGGGHIDEGDIGANKSMAHYFKKLSKIDPYTVNQVKFSSAQETNDSIYIMENTRLYDNDLYLSNCLNSDQIVIGENEFNRNYNIARTNLAKGTAYAIYIYHDKEFQLDSTAIPIYLSLSKKDTIQLNLSKGTYRYLERDQDGGIIHQEIIEIE